MYGFGGAHLDAFAAQTAFVVVDIRHVVANGDGLELTFLDTFSATDAGCFACLHGYGTLVFVDA